MKNKKVIITVVVLIVAIGAYFGVTKLQQNLNRKAIDSSAVADKGEDKVTDEKKEEEKKPETSESSEKTAEVKNQEQPKSGAQNNEPPKQNSEPQKQATQSNNTQPQSSSNTKAPEQKVNNFSVVDSSSGKTMVVGYVAIQSGDTVESATERFLKEQGVSFKNKDGYLSRIGDLKERDKGPNSGWCYFVNGVKGKIGMRNLTLKSGDKIEWKFLTDGVNN